MYTGTMIEELVTMVETVERRATTNAGPALPPPMRARTLPLRLQAFPVWSTYMYEWPAREQAVMGVA